MLTFEQITQLVELVARNQLGGVELEKSGFRLKIDGHRAAAQTLALPAEAAGTPLATAAAAPRPAASPATSSEPEATSDPNLHVLTSPIVGTFYRSPSPDQSPFVEVGSRVTKGQVLCIVEAMKLMNEIEADVDGVIQEIYPQNAQPVEFGQPLFGIRVA